MGPGHTIEPMLFATLTENRLLRFPIKFAEFPSQSADFSVFLSYPSIITFLTSRRRHPAGPDMSEPTKILIVRPSALGDVCRTVPALASLRRRYPEARIDWVVNSAYQPAIVAHPHLSHVIPFPRDRFAHWWRSPRAFGELSSWLRALRANRYDLVLDLQGLGRSGFITRTTAAPRRVGYRSAREYAWLGYTTRHAPPKSRHAVDQMLELLAREGIPAIHDMRLYAPDAGRDVWQDRAAMLGLTPDTSYAVLAPTSRWLSKRWPPEYWVNIIPRLRHLGFERSLIIGAPGEEPQIQPLIEAARAGTVDAELLIGQTGIAETMAIIASAGLVIANDSAPLHMAVGFGRPLLGLFGPTDPAVVGPYRHDHSVLRTPDAERPKDAYFKDSQLGDRLMRAITPDMVLDAVERIVSTSPTDPPVSDGAMPGSAETADQLDAISGTNRPHT